MNNKIFWLLAVPLLIQHPAPAEADLGPALTGLSAMANDATTAFSGPAGITRLDTPQLVLQTSLAYTRSKFTVDEATTTGGDGEDDTSLLAIPGLFYVNPLTDRLSVGLSINVPSGIGYDYGNGWAGRYHTTRTQLTFFAGSAVAAYRLTDKLSVAAGPYMMYLDSETESRVNNLLPRAGDGRVKLSESGADIGYVISMLYEFSDSTRIGATYHSELQPDLDGTPSFHNIDPLYRKILAAADLLGTTVKVDFTVPAIAQAGFYTEFADNWSITGDLLWLDMSEFGVTQLKVQPDSIAAKSRYRDMWIMNVGLRYSYAPEHAVSVGGIYGTSPVKDSKRNIARPLDRLVGGGIGLEMPVYDHPCRFNLNYFDLGDGDVKAKGDPFTGDFSGSFAENWALMFDFQIQI
ncbi:MAG: OmpP1/FadL family transporter [Desulfopila sp.]